MFRYSMPIRFADVDHAGTVYYPRFFDLFHVAREELWRERLGPYAYRDAIDKQGIGFPAVHAECDFKAPLRFGDIVDIDMTIARMGTKSITFRYRVYRLPLKEGEARTLCAEGRVVCAIVDLAVYQAVPIPDHLREVLADLVES